MDGAIFLRSDSELIPMEEEAYDSEAVLQENLAAYPKLLAGDQMNETNPRRWLLIEREAQVPDSEFSDGRWSADHLFVDQEGIPTIVEVKRSSDTRSRRNVVGQMLDYAAHATTYWRDGRIQSQFEVTCTEQNEDPEQILLDWLPESIEIDEFWDTVESNLRSGRIRMLFVADEIKRELKRIVEFLNEQMDTAEVLAVEVKQFRGGEMTALVPRLIGQTEEARQNKSRSSTKSYAPLLLELRDQLERRDNIPEIEGDLLNTFTKNPRRKLVMDLPVDDRIADAIKWEIQPELADKGTVTLRLRSWNATDGMLSEIYDAVRESRDFIEDRDFELLLRGTHLLEKSIDAPATADLDEDLKEEILSDFEWFVSDVYEDIYRRLTPEV